MENLYHIEEVKVLYCTTSIKNNSTGTFTLCKRYIRHTVSACMKQ